jgi:hypothetical protein
MRKINNSYLGNFYIEELENREEQDRVKLYDSDEKYLDYLPIERHDDSDPTEEEQYNGYIEMLESFKNVLDLMDWLVCDCDFIGNKDQTIKYLHEELNWDLPSGEYNPLDNEWVNRIGDIYIVISEY